MFTRRWLMALIINMGMSAFWLSSFSSSLYFDKVWDAAGTSPRLISVTWPGRATATWSADLLVLSDCLQQNSSISPAEKIFIFHKQFHSRMERFSRCFTAGDCRNILSPTVLHHIVSSSSPEKLSIKINLWNFITWETGKRGSFGKILVFSRPN